METSGRLRIMILRLAHALTSGAILLVFSEWLFWARPLPGMLPPEGLATFLVYAVAAYVFLLLVGAFRVRSLPALFLAGAGYGWLVEGVFVQTMYDDLPLSLSFTGLAWHALFSVLIGWYALPLILRRGRRRSTAALASAVGVAYGLWALWWWTEAPPAASLSAFAAFSIGGTLVLAIAYGLAARLPPVSFRPSRLETIGALALIGAFFAFVAVPSRPVALAVLPPLLLVLWAALRRNARCEARPDLLAWFAAQPPPRLTDLLMLGCLPLTATIVYGLAGILGAHPKTGWVLYALSVPAGFGLFIGSVVAILRKKPLLVRTRPTLTGGEAETS
jgi:hypothetical protein